MRSRGELLVRGSFARVSNLLLGIAIAFFMMPYLVGNLGERMYGLWALLGSFLAYYGLLDLGFSAAVGRFIARAVGRNDGEEVKTLTSTAFYLYLALGVLALAFTAVLAWNVDRFVSNPDDARIVRFLMILIGINASVDFPVHMYSAVLSSHIRDDLGNGVGIARGTLTAVLMVFAIERGYGIIGVGVAVVVTSVMGSLAYVVMAYRLDPNVTVDPRRFSWPALRTLAGYSGYVVVGRVADILRFRVDHLVITAFVGLRAVTMYTVAVRLVEHLSNLVSQMVRVIGPLMSQEEGRNDFDSIRSKFLISVRISCYVSIFGGGVALIYGKAFIARWMGPAFAESYVILVILLLPMMISLIQRPTVPLLYGISQHKYFTYSNMVEGIANLLLSLLWVRSFGAQGVALGTAVPMAVMAAAVQPVYLCRVLSMPYRTYAGTVLKHAALGTAFLLAGWLPLLPYIDATYGRLAGCILIQAMLYVPLAILAGFSREERRQIFGFVRGAMLIAKKEAPAPGA